MVSLRGIRFLLKKILIPVWKLCFSLFNVRSFFYWLKSFHSFFLLTNLTIIFCVLEVGLPIQWHATISFASSLTSISDKTVLSKLSSFWGIPLKSTLLRLPYWAKSLWTDSSMKNPFYLQNSIFILQVVDYYFLQIDDFIFQTVNALNYGLF